MSITLRRALIVLVTGIILLMIGLVSYSVRVWSTANGLVASAAEIRSTADAKRQIAVWRNRSGRSFSEETSPNGKDRSYDVGVENGLLHRLRIVPPTMVGMTVTMRNGELCFIILTMFTGWNPNTTSGVWVQEWFGPGAVDGFHVNAKDRPWKATVEFSSAVQESDRMRAFALNTVCFVRPGGCRSAEDILPGVWSSGPHSGTISH
jgi:hypothetical protein